MLRLIIVTAPLHMGRDKISFIARLVGPQYAVCPTRRLYPPLVFTGKGPQDQRCRDEEEYCDNSVTNESETVNSSRCMI